MHVFLNQKLNISAVKQLSQMCNFTIKENGLVSA